MGPQPLGSSAIPTIYNITAADIAGPARGNCFRVVLYSTTRIDYCSILSFGDIARATIMFGPIAYIRCTRPRDRQQKSLSDLLCDHTSLVGNFCVRFSRIARRRSITAVQRITPVLLTRVVPKQRILGRYRASQDNVEVQCNKRQTSSVSSAPV